MTLFGSIRETHSGRARQMLCLKKKKERFSPLIYEFKRSLFRKRSGASTSFVSWRSRRYLPLTSPLQELGRRRTTSWPSLTRVYSRGSGGGLHPSSRTLALTDARVWLGNGLQVSILGSWARREVKIERVGCHADLNRRTHCWEATRGRMAPGQAGGCRGTHLRRQLTAGN